MIAIETIIVAVGIIASPFIVLLLVMMLAYPFIKLLKRRNKRKAIKERLAHSKKDINSWYFLTKMPTPAKSSEKSFEEVVEELKKLQDHKDELDAMSKLHKGGNLYKDPTLYSDEFNRTPLYTTDKELTKTAIETTVVKEKLKPSEVKKHLDDFVVGQDKAKKILSTSMYNHYKRLEMNNFADTLIKKSNILLVGPTGSGKTLIASTLAKKMKVPFFAMDVSSITGAGYVGRKVEDVVDGLMSAAAKLPGDSRTNARKGVVFLDEIDKIASNGNNRGDFVSSSRVQQELLKLLEGVKMDTTKHKDVDISEVLFILGGAFSGIERIVGDRVSKKSIGFGADVGDSSKKKGLLVDNLKVEDIVKYGMMPELLGRVSTVAVLEKLTEDDIVRVLTEPKDAIVKEYVALLSCDDVELEFTPGSLKAIAKEAVKSNTGARGLRTVMETVLLDLMYKLPDSPKVKKVVITKGFVEKQINK
jgi:ATP-dependent Clp protease ATP-binding subunit ClpX